jgi:putative chitinase
MDISKLKDKIPDSVYNELETAVVKFGITNNLRLAHFLSQCAHESADFKFLNENLNYSAKGLRGIFGKYFPTDAIAKQYERQPQKIGNRVYASRMGNGDEASGEGYKFRGRGFIQLTGKSNYTQFGTFIGEDLVANPDLVATKYPLSSACYFFHKNNLWAICDKGDTNEVVKQVTQRVNGGTHGLDDRIQKFIKFKGILA